MGRANNFFKWHPRHESYIKFFEEFDRNYFQERLVEDNDVVGTPYYWKATRLAGFLCTFCHSFFFKNKNQSSCYCLNFELFAIA